MDSIVYILIQLLVMICVAPLVNGIIKKIKALSQKRKGAPVLQLYYDIFKLMKKDTVVSETSSWIFKAAPYVIFTANLCAALLIPVTTLIQPVSFAGDIILSIYILALGRFFLTLAALDTGSTFGGMGSSREMMISSIFEPSMLVSLFTIGLMAKSTSAYTMMVNATQLGPLIIQPVYVLVFLAVFIILMAETSRIPIDDPATHLELTMVHEAMILEYSGKHLALMELGASIKQLILITLLANLFIPLDALIHMVNPAMVVIVSLLLYLAKVIFISVLVAIAEISTVKLRLFSVPNLAAISFILSFLGFAEYFIVGR
ncbi:MAG TPA: NADH-quinone oxidoreductase subunit H [Clostridia bacterium]|nr:NADH-quinone oxidoreductase subunit H [Clostridia bacterium]